MDENDELRKDLAQLARLALAEQFEDVRLFVARLVRKYRDTMPDLAKEMDRHLRTKSPRAGGVLRKSSQPLGMDLPLPVDDESQLNLLKSYVDLPQSIDPPLLTRAIQDQLDQLVQERQQADYLSELGLSPTRSAIFVGPPGVGKTLTTRWLAARLETPLYVLDLTAVMSSLLGRSGGNLRAALDFAKRRPCALLLDEIDAIAKRRSDETDVGELKRLVTVILQEVDEWPTTGLLLAATNHPDLIDPALWRRFDLTIHFPSPDGPTIQQAIQRFLGPDCARFEPWIDILVFAFKGASFSDVEREIHRFRRSLALKLSTERQLVEIFLQSRPLILPRQERIDLAGMLAQRGQMSQRAIAELIGVSRDTIRKYGSASTPQKPTSRSANQ
ncbi:MAG: ATP-binding protein [Magnetococcales bacterium]|nr:ATP-binding protein [Magnetococcales bacterium]